MATNRQKCARRGCRRLARRSSAGPPPLYCSHSCQLAEYSRRRRERRRRKRKVYVRSCLCCDAPFKARRDDAYFCSAKCRKRGSRKGVNIRKERALARELAHAATAPERARLAYLEAKKRGDASRYEQGWLWDEDEAGGS